MFQRWRNFQFDEATDTIDSYVLRLKQCAQMLKLNEGQVLELFKYTLPTIYYYLLCCIQNLREAVESAKCVVTKGNLDKQLVGQRSTPYMSLKIHSSEKQKSVKFDEYKLLEKQINRLVEVKGSRKTGPQERQNQVNRP